MTKKELEKKLEEKEMILDEIFDMIVREERDCETDIIDNNYYSDNNNDVVKLSRQGRELKLNFYYSLIRMRNYLNKRR